MKGKRILFVEGPDDQHSIWAICEHYQLPETFGVEIPDGKGKINRKAKPTELGGVDNVLKALDFNVIEGSSAIECVGVVLDADQNLAVSWGKVATILRRAGYANVPLSPDVAGTIVTQEFLPKVGVWLMPDNQLHGALEDFLAYLVPDADTNELWAQAVKCSDEILCEVAEGQRFSAIHLCKARIHSYLAWQKECGKPFGQAITAKYLQADKPECRVFVAWLERLFVA